MLNPWFSSRSAEHVCDSRLRGCTALGSDTALGTQVKKVWTQYGILMYTTSGYIRYTHTGSHWCKSIGRWPWRRFQRVIPRSVSLGATIGLWGFIYLHFNYRILPQYPNISINKERKKHCFLFAVDKSQSMATAKGIGMCVHPTEKPVWDCKRGVFRGWAAYVWKLAELSGVICCVGFQECGVENLVPFYLYTRTGMR